MSDSASRFSGIGLNVVLAALGIAALLLIWSLVAQWRSGSSGDDPIRRTDDLVQVEVLNGCGVSQVAADMTAFLREEGFDVLEAGNHDNFDEAETYILNRSGNDDASRALAQALGLPESRIREDIQPDRYLDVSLIIGGDYADFAPFMSSD